MARGQVRYDLTLSYEVTRAGDIDIIDEARFEPALHDSPVDALGHLGSFIHLNGGPDAWNEVDSQEIGSCWLPNDEDTEISYRARLERVILPEDAGGHPLRAIREPAALTWNRVNIASFGALGRKQAEGPAIDDPDAGGETCPVR